VTHPDGLIMAQVLFFFLSFISWIEYGFQYCFLAYRHGLQITAAGASLSKQRLIARSGYSGQLWILQAGGKNDVRFSQKAEIL